MQGRLRELKEEAFPAGPPLDAHAGLVDAGGKRDVPERRLVVAIEPVLGVSHTETEKPVARSTAVARRDLVWRCLAVKRYFEEGPSPGMKHPEHLRECGHLFERLEEFAKRRPKAKHDAE
jgi:hypothetical protein